MSEPTRRVIEARWQLALRHPLLFARWFVWTLDSGAAERSAVRPFPWERPHIQAMTRVFLGNPMMMVEKSRQMTATWWAAMIALWTALQPGRFVMLQSKRLDDAVGNADTGDGLLGRAKFMLRHIPYPDWVLPRARNRYESLTFPEINSGLQAIPEGGDKIRSHTLSGLVSDETAFQPEFGRALMAAIATVRAESWLIGITTPDLGDGGQSYRVIRDLADDDVIDAGGGQ